MWTKLYDLDGRCVDTFTDINALKDRVADQCETLSEHVSIDDQYDASGDCVEFVRVKDIGIVGTLDSPAPKDFTSVTAR